MTLFEPAEPGEWFASRGGAYHARRMLTRIANRYAGRDASRYNTVGLRLFAPFGPKA